MSEADDNIKLSENLTPGERSREGPGNQPGRISGSITAEKSGEGPGNQSGGISRLSATGGKGTKRKLNTKSYSEKYKAIIEVEEGKKSRKQIAAEYGVPQNTLLTWLKNKDSIKSKYVSVDIEPDRKKSRTAKFPEVDEAMLKWFENARSQNISVEGPVLQMKGREFAEQLGIPSSDFECSSGWVERFKNRYGLVSKKVSGESNSVDKTGEEFENWQSRLPSILEKYRPDDVFNADETAIFYRAMPDKTLEFKTKACHGGKVNKERLTAMVCANMSGTEKLPLLVLGKSEKPRCFKNVRTLPTQYKAN
ncbi:tigger transposable element-derived protein 4-like [Ruditapes philippinarum]|uniref:tigger transposable element-derived protein 4-like n=1 Tax=Ruditapes philippinarum TaxID=129788 RepID=UPI00295C1422|nr:tigger transposable element-derived protein 4-like [Ruditapes philippinarum]